MYVCDYLPINAIASGKKAERFWDSWSATGICMYLKSLSSANLFGTLGVTFKMYLIPHFFSKSMSAEFLAFPR